VNYWKVVIATMAIFGAGVLTGGLLVRMAETPRAAKRVWGPAAQRPMANSVAPGGARLELLRRMERELALTPDQRDKVSRILAESQERSRKMMEPVSPALREEAKRAKAEFRAVLSPEQQASFDRLSKVPHSRELKSPERRFPARTNPEPAKP
jgi:Spy/CpxP family protein refolding chaperone